MLIFFLVALTNSNFTLSIRSLFIFSISGDFATLDVISQSVNSTVAVTCIFLVLRTFAKQFFTASNSSLMSQFAIVNSIDFECPCNFLSNETPPSMKRTFFIGTKNVSVKVCLYGYFTIAGGSVSIKVCMYGCFTLSGATSLEG